ncbi:MAG: diguanylate cyclase [Methylococcaceae bacterium]|nr:diguanylate cyclase [Methylococcaceae bacterium]
MQVLIIENCQATRLLVIETVVAMGHAVKQIENAQEALSYLKEHSVDLLLMAIEPPALNEFETTKALRALTPDDWFPIVFLADKVDDKLYERGIKAGGDTFWEQPINPARLQAQITAMERIDMLRKKYQAAQIGMVKLNDTLSYLSLFDELTGLANRRNFDDTLRREFKLAQREIAPLSLLICDIDFLKRYNEKHGQLAGDNCLRAVATAIASVLQRPTDLACRYGGEEFTVILPNTDASGALDISEKIRAALKKRKIPHLDSPISRYVSLSIGIASFDGQFELVAAFIKASDDALRRAKVNGRNRVEAHL